ncbi:hypothetical protein ACFL7D_09270 [candidate division KSB1 bacterium]
MKNIIRILSALTVLVLGLSTTLLAQAPAPPPAPVGTIPWGNPAFYGAVILLYGLWKMHNFKKD